MADIFDRSEKLLGKDIVDKLKSTTVLVCGVGGVGAYAVEALARLGIGHLILIDDDVVEETNINRQLIALHSTIGKPKVEVAKQRILDINKDCKVDILKMYLDMDTISKLDDYKFDYVVDAIDAIKSKVDLIKYCQAKGIEEIVCAGMGKRIDPSKVEVTKLNQTSGDPLCKKLRELVKKENLEMSKIFVIFSKEEQIKNKQNEDATPSSIVLVPAYAGLLAAHFVLKKVMEV